MLRIRTRDMNVRYEHSARSPTREAAGTTLERMPAGSADSSMMLVTSLPAGRYFYQLDADGLRVFLAPDQPAPATRDASRPPTPAEMNQRAAAFWRRRAA